jgi:peptidoglycan hydrolase CwlO-like protein
VTVTSHRTKLALVVLLLAGTALAGILLADNPAQSQTIAGQQARAESLRAAVRAESRRIAATADGIAEAEGRLRVLDARVAKRQEQARDAQDRLIGARVRLTRLERNADEYKKTLATNLIAAYKTPAPDLLGVAVEAKGFDDLLSQLRFLKDISDRNATILRDTRRARKAVQGQAAALAKLRLRLIQLAKQANDDRAEANVLRNALLRKQADQLRRRSGAQSQLSTVRARIASLERQQAADALRNSGSQGATDQAPPAPPAPAAGAPPAQGNDAVAKVVAAANEIATTPYVWGGGHGGSASGGYDCSGSLSYALAAAGLVNGSLTSGGFMSWGEAGPGSRITVYANAGHAFMIVDGRRYDTSALRGGGTRWSSSMRGTAGFVARHPPGL